MGSQALKPDFKDVGSSAAFENSGTFGDLARVSERSHLSIRVATWVTKRDSQV